MLRAPRVDRRLALTAASILSAVVYFAPAIAPIVAGAAHRAYHVSEGIRLQHELAQRRAIEAILTPHGHEQQHAHLDTRAVHTHFAGDTPHSHSTGVDVLLAVAGDGNGKVGTPSPVAPRLASHVPAHAPPVPVGWVADQPHVRAAISGPVAEGPPQLDPPPRS
jgi:hypothetical protein